MGIDVRGQSQAAAPDFSPLPEAYPTAQKITIRSATPGALIRFTRNWGTPNAQHGEEYKRPVKLEEGTVLAAMAYTHHLACSPAVIAPYRIGESVRVGHGGQDGRTVAGGGARSRFRRPVRLRDGLAEEIGGGLAFVAALRSELERR